MERAVGFFHACSLQRTLFRKKMIHYFLILLGLGVSCLIYFPLAISTLRLRAGKSISDGTHHGIVTTEILIKNPQMNLIRRHFSEVFSKSNRTQEIKSLIYIYDASEIQRVCPSLNVSLSSKLLKHLFEIDYITKEPEKAGTFVVVLFDGMDKSCNQFPKFSYWRGGQNHLVIVFSHDVTSSDIRSHFHTNIGEAVLAQPNFKHSTFQNSRDLVVPACLDGNYNTLYNELPMLVPIRRKYLITFSGVQPKHIKPHEMLIYIGLRNKSQVYLDLACSIGRTSMKLGEWSLCGNGEARKWALGNATFALVPFPSKEGRYSTVSFQMRFAEALKFGSIPVCIGETSPPFPFQEILDWRRAALLVQHRLSATKLVHILSSYKNNEIFELKRQGRILWNAYFRSPRVILETALLVLRMRSLDPGPSPPLFPSEVWTSITLASKDKVPSHRHIYSTEDFHRMGDPFHEFSAMPFDPPFSPDAITKEKRMKFDVFKVNQYRKLQNPSKPLGGNFPAENLSIVILNYKRLGALKTQIERLAGLPFVERIIGVWNDLKTDPTGVNWPDSNGKFLLILSKKNSLNNRFIPYDAVETEAVLIMDDDLMPTVQDIIFSFRVWRQERDRIVGLFSRHILWNGKSQSWRYYALPSREYSMILTGAMIIHKYYLYIYTFVMPAVIREIVDAEMNCEDLAMNFLVAHISRKPPLKTSTGYSSRCRDPSCKKGLSSRRSHYSSRSQCINVLARIYGYVPLLYTQYRAESSLYSKVKKG